jgi:hypothetical protein
LLSLNQLSTEVKKDLEMDIFAIDSTLLIAVILKANRSHLSLEKLRELARDKKLDLMLEDGFLFRHGLLMVPDTDDNLRTQLIQEIHTPISSAYLSPGKTIKLLRTRYF